MHTTPAIAANARTRTAPRPARDPYRDAAGAARLATKRLAALPQTGPGPAMVLLAIVAEISLYSRINADLGVARIAAVSGMDRRTTQRSLAYLVDHGIVVRIVPERSPGSGTPRAMVGLPWPPPDGEDRDATETVKAYQKPLIAPVQNPGGGGARDTQGGAAHVTPRREVDLREERKVLTRMAVCAALTPRDGGRQVAALAVGVKSRITNARRSMEWTRPDRPTPDPGRSAERQAMQREIDQRRENRGTP